MSENTMKVTCPHCKELLRVNKPEKPGRYTYKCPKCGKPFAVEIKDAPKPAEPKPIEPKPAEEISSETRAVSQTQRSAVLFLYRKRRFRSDERMTLSVGSNTIGRKSEKKPSDYMFDDEFMSQRSVSIILELDKDNNSAYLFNLLRAANPAYYNDKQIAEGASFYLKDGDTFQIGKTQFYLTTAK